MKRIILAALFVPALIIIIRFLPWYNHLVLNLLIIAFAFMGGWELAAMHNEKGLGIKPAWGAFFTSFPPAIFFITSLFSFPVWAGPLLFMFIASAALAQAGFPGKDTDISISLVRSGVIAGFLIYPGLFMLYLMRITFLPFPAASMFMFLTMVFMNDSFAYFVGMAFGRSNKGIFKVSPNKSVAGLFGGWGGSIVGALVCSFLVAGPWEGQRWMLIPLATVVSIFSVVGDLVESAFKRSAGVKDSGKLLGGRGGVLDSLDSLMFAAPVFYYWMSFLG